MTDLLARIWLVAEPIVWILTVCALLGALIGGVYGLITGFTGDDRD